MQRYKKLFCLAVLLSFTGCATLTQSQLNEVNAFGKLTNSFSAYPGTIVATCNRIHAQSEIYGANSESSPDLHVQAILQIHDFINKTNVYTPKIDLSLKIINQYAQGLVLLTSSKHNLSLDTAATKFGTNLDALITDYNKVEPKEKLPTGIGSAVAAVITLGGDMYIRRKQAEDIKQVLPIGDQIIDKVTANLLTFLGLTQPDTINTKTLSYLIYEERKSIIIHYQKYLELNRDAISLDNNKTKMDGYIIHRRFATIADDRNFLQMLQDIDSTEVLRVQCIQAVTGLRECHAKLLKDVQEKITLKEYAKELQNYSAEVKTAYNTIKAIK